MNAKEDSTDSRIVRRLCDWPRRASYLGGALLLALTTMGLGHDCDGGAPSPSGCEDPVTGPFDLTIGTGEVDGSFVPLSDGDPLTVVRGAQGALMALVRVGLTGADGSSCISARVEVSDLAGSPLDAFEGNLSVATEGAVVTSEVVYFIVGDWPDEVLVSTRAGDFEVSRRLVVPSEPTTDP